MEKIAIIILAWNKVEYTKKCVESIYLNTDLDMFNIFLVNNGSTDETSEYFKSISQEKSNITIFTNENNLGFGLGMNTAIEKIMKLDYNYICILNNDTEVTSDWLKHLYDCSSSDIKIGVVQPTMLRFSDGAIIDCGADVGLTDKNYIEMMDLNKPPQEIESMQIDRLYLSGFCLLMKKKFIEDVGLFREEFFPAYHEETDLCIRGHMKGWKNVFCGKSKVKHHYRITALQNPDAEYFFWGHWDIILKKYSSYFQELCEKKYGLDFNKTELERYGKNLDIEKSSKMLAEQWNYNIPKTPSDVDDFYKNSSGYIGDLLIWNSGEYKKQIINHVSYASKFFKINGILDIGAGILSDTIKLRNAGINMTCVDFDSEHYRFGQWRLQQRRITDVIIKHVGDDLKQQDAVMMFDVIEHVHNPDKFLDFYASKAKRAIFMTVPENIPPDESIKHPMHLIEYADFWKQIPRYLEEKHGFKRVDMVTFIKE